MLKKFIAGIALCALVIPTAATAQEVSQPVDRDACLLSDVDILSSLYNRVLNHLFLYGTK